MNAISELLEHWSSLSFAHLHMLWFALAPLVLVPAWRRLSRAVANTFGHGHKIKNVAWPGRLCLVLFILMWECFVCALAEPRIMTWVMTQAYQAREFVIGIDRSGSMSMNDVDGAELAKKVREWEKAVYAKALQKREQFPDLYPNPPDKPQEVSEVDQAKLTRYQVARWAAVQFVESRMKSSEEATKQGKQGDRAGMFTFDDEAYWAWPLSSDLDVVTRKIEFLLTDARGGGTNFEGPSDGNPRIGAFQAGINHFRKWGAKGVKTRVIILISDGDAGISEKRQEELLQQMKEEGLNIHIYALVCGAESQLQNSSTESVRKLIKAVNPDDPNQPEFQKAVIWTGSGEAMQEAFALINRLEASSIEGEPTAQNRDVRHEFIVLGCVFGALFIACCAAFRENF